jgi:anaerobic magnesium-protoporphyrin IX monomethyl ester cyclase
MRILFTHSYFLRFDQKQLHTASPYAPLATLYAAALLRQNGCEVKLADLQFAFSAAEIEDHILNFKPQALVIYDDGFNYLTKMCLSNMRAAAFAMQQVAKKNGLQVIVSGSDATDNIGEYCKNGADYVIIGEAEHSLLELVKALEEKTDTDKIPGLAYIKNDTLVKTPGRQVTRELDEFPPPAWDLINIEPYRNMWLNRHGYFSLNFVTTRGCPYKCNWCAKPIYGNRYNSHSPAYIVALIKETQQKFSYTHIWFADDIFGLKPGWLKEFSFLIKKENIKIRYKIQSRADLLLEDENIRYLAESGCDTVWLGAESGSQRILDAMDKGITTEEIKKAVHLLKKHRIKPALFLQFGYLDEKAEDIRKTIDMVNELLPYDIGVSVSYPLPGTKFYDKVKEQLRTKTNWTDSDDLHLMFKNTYSPEFYRHLHRYVHHSYRANQARAMAKEFSLDNYKRIGLWPYYKFKSLREKSALKRIDPLAAGIL